MGTNYLPETTMQKYKVYKDQQDFPVIMFVKIFKILNKEGSVIYVHLKQSNDNMKLLKSKTNLYMTLRDGNMLYKIQNRIYHMESFCCTTKYVYTITKIAP